MVSVLSALLTPIIAFLGCYIAWEQWRVNDLNLKHALFKKRYRQFEATRDFVASIMTRGKVLADERLKWIEATRGARFILGGAIADYFEELFQKSSKLQALESMFDFNASDKVRSENAERQEEIKRWFEAEWRKGLDERFASHLELKKLKPSIGGFLVGTVGVLGVIVVALLLVHARDAAFSRFELAVGAPPGGSVVFRLDRSSGEVCAYRWYNDEQLKEHEGFKRINCVAEGVQGIADTEIGTAPTKPR